MEMNRLTREADELIRKVVARYNSLYSPSGTVSQVELDLLLDDLRQMYEKFKTIGQINLQHQQQEPRKITIPPSSKPEPNRESATSVSNSRETEPELKAPSTIESQPETRSTFDNVMNSIVSSIENVDSGAEIENRVPAEAEVPDNHETPIFEASSFVKEEPVQTLADKYKNSQKSLSETMSSGTEDDSLGSRLGHQHVADLKSVIGIAEKFSFINELFGGDPIAYEKAIAQLNGASRLTEAEAYLGTLRLNHKWPADSSQAVLLSEIIRRKFGV
jgi:hypothetical protein